MRDVASVFLGLIILLAGILYYRHIFALPALPEPIIVVMPQPLAILKINVTKVVMWYEGDSERRISEPVVGSKIELYDASGKLEVTNLTDENGIATFVVKPGVYEVAVTVFVEDFFKPLKVYRRFEVRLAGGVESRFNVIVYSFSPKIKRVEYIDYNSDGLIYRGDIIKLFYNYHPIGELYSVRSVIYMPNRTGIISLSSHNETEVSKGLYLATFLISSRMTSYYDPWEFSSAIIFSDFNIKIYRVWWSGYS